MSKKKNTVSTFRILPITTGIGLGYRRLTIRLEEMNRRDAVADIKNWLHNPTEAVKRTEFAQKLHAETGGTEHFQDAHFSDCRIDFVWQDDSDSRDKWYGIRCDVYRPSNDAIALLNRAHKAVGSIGFSSSPRFIVEKLMAAGFVPVRWIDGVQDCHVRTEIDLDATFPGFKPEPAKELASA